MVDAAWEDEVSCACAELTEKGLPPPAGWKCNECGAVGVGLGPIVEHQDLESLYIDRVERAFDYAYEKWRQGGRAWNPDYNFTRDFVIFRLKNPDSL